MIHHRLLTEFGMLVFYTNKVLWNFRSDIWPCGPGRGSLDKNIQVMLDFLKVPFLVLHFFYFKLMIFLMMLSVILLSMLMILLSILSVIRHLICGNNLNWLLNLNLIYKTLDWGKKWLVGFNAGKTQLVLFDWSNKTGSIDVKMEGLFLRKNHVLRCWG